MDYMFFSVSGAREEARTAGDEVEAVAAAKMVTYVRTLMQIYLYIYTEAGIVDDNEVEATTVAMWSHTYVIYTPIHTPM